MQIVLYNICKMVLVLVIVEVVVVLSLFTNSKSVILSVV